MKSLTRQEKHKLLTGAAVLAIACASPMGAYAQDSDTEEAIENITVTGIRGSLRDSISQKKANESIVEALSAEDIGKLPDISIADSLARLPGLTAQRIDGRGQMISVRGLSPDFTTALLNGRQQVSTGDNRGVEFDQYPSELLSSVVVYKTPDAALIGQGMAGTADLQTIRPLAEGERILAASYRHEWTEKGALNAGTDDTGFRRSFTWVDQNEAGTVGFAFGYAGTKTITQAEKWDAWGYPASGPGGELLIGGAKPFVQSEALERDGFIGVLEFEPSDTFRTAIDVYYSDFSDELVLRGIEFPLAWSSASLQPGYTVTDGLITSGQFNGVKGVVRNDKTTRDSELWSLGWRTEWVGDNWTVMADLSRSSVERSDVILESYSGTGHIDIPGGWANVGATDNLGFSLRGRTGAVFSSILDYADPTLIGLTSPQGWGYDAVDRPYGQHGYYNNPDIEDTLKALRLEASREFDSWISSVQLGVNISNREKTKIVDEHFVQIASGAPFELVPSQYILGSTALDFLGIDGMLSYDPIALLSAGILELQPHAHKDIVLKSWSVEEDVFIAYAKMGLDTSWGNTPVTGNFGVQIVRTDQESDGFGVTLDGGGALVIGGVTRGDTFTEVLPSGNVTFELSEDSFIRLAAARTLARPRMDEMNASFGYGYNPALASSTDINNSPWGGGGGNPELRPWIANAYDISYERYFGDGEGYVAIAAFYKDLQSYIYTQSLPYDFTGFSTFGNPEPAMRWGLANIPSNGTGGKLQGLEFSLSLPGAVVHDALEGFGLIFTHSYTESDIVSNPGSPATPIPGLSEDVGNLTVYFEQEGFSARVSRRYRGTFLGEMSGFGAGRDLRMVQEEAIVDAQIGYRFESGPLEGLSITFQGNNLTDEPYSTYDNLDERQVKHYQTYGAKYLLGFSYRM